MVPSIFGWLSHRASPISGTHRSPRDLRKAQQPAAATGFVSPEGPQTGPAQSKRAAATGRRTTPRKLKDSLRKNIRRGTATVELALVLPVLLAIYFSIIEFGHAYLSTQLIKTAARQAGRLGVSSGKTTDQVVAEAQRVLRSIMDPSKATIYVKDAASFDDDGTAPSNIQALANVEVNNLDSRHLFLVRIEVPYNAISLFPAGFWHTHVHGLTLSGQAAMRHE